MERRELFSSLKSSFTQEEKIESFIYPPYFKSETLFHEICPTCSTKECQKNCEVNIIDLNKDGIPILNFSNSGCTYCDECAIACPSEVLTLENKSKINAKFKIGLLECISWHQTMCFSCKDPCLDDAIKFLGLFRPEIDENLCTSCGFCIKVCPTDAITFDIIKK